MGLITMTITGSKNQDIIYTILDAMAGTRLQLAGEGSWVTGFASSGMT